MISSVDRFQPATHIHQATNMDLISKIQEAWGWVGIEPIKVVGDNDFGNLVVRHVYSKYWRICPENVYRKVVAQESEELE